MPYANEHSCRLNDPAKYKGKFARKNCEQKHDGKCIDVIYGIISKDESEVQALRFPTKVWTEKAAKSVCKERKGMFEPAAKKKKSDEQEDIERRMLKADALELRIIGDGDEPKHLVGYAAVFNTLSSDLGGWQEKIAPGAFAETIQRDDIRALVDHDSRLLLGRNKAKTLSLGEDEKGLAFDVILPDTQAGRDVLVSINRGDISGCSFGFRTLKDTWEHQDDDKTVDIRTLEKVKLYDVSVTAFPAYPATSVSSRSFDAWRETLDRAEAESKQADTDILRRRLALAEAE